MTMIAILFVAGLLLLGFEVFIPGGVLGVLGGLALLGGVGLAFVDFGLGGGLGALLVAVVLVGIVLYFEFAVLPKTAMGRRLFLQSAVTGRTGVVRERDFVGSVGLTSTALAPTGYVEIDGRRHEAFSRSGFLEPGVPVKVVGADNFRLIVISNPSVS